MSLLSDPPHRCSISSPSYSKDDAGGSVLAWTTVAASEPCQFDIGGGNVEDRFGGGVLNQTATVFFTRAVVQHGYRLEYPVGSGKVWILTGGPLFLEGMGNIPDQYECSAERVTTPT